MKKAFILAGSTALLFVASMAVADIVSGPSTTGSSTNMAITNLILAKPADMKVGDVMVASIAVRNGSAVSIVAPSGWTQILRTDNDTNISIVSYWKVVGASESANYTWVLSPQTRAEGGITPYSGVDAANPVDTAAGNFGRGNVATTSPVNAKNVSERIVAVYAIHVGSNNVALNFLSNLFARYMGSNSLAEDFFSDPTGMTEKYDVSNTKAGPTIASFDAMQSAAGVASSNSSTILGNQKRDWVSQQIALKKPSLVCTGGATADIGGSRIHTFTSNGTLVCTSSGTAKVIVIGGGGGGGGRNTYGSSAGGAGGGYAESDLSLAATTYSVTVGAGGAGGVSFTTNGVNGGDSWFGSTGIILAKGGAGSGNGPGTNGGQALGGAATLGIGTIRNSGGDGGTAGISGEALNGEGGGGGGGSGGHSSAGGSGGNSTPGTGGTSGTAGDPNGGAGGTGGSTGSGSAGLAPGGGGGGAGNSVGIRGRPGASGIVIVEYPI